MANEVRIDKWLWAVRIYKTRSIAAEECKKGRILINGALAKPSRTVKVGDIVSVKKCQILFAYKLTAIAQNRMAAKLVPNYLDNVTSKEQMEMFELLKFERQNARARGLGRPTKKDRRAIESFVDEDPYLFFDDWGEDEDYDNEDAKLSQD